MSSQCVLAFSIFVTLFDDLTYTLSLNLMIIFVDIKWHPLAVNVYIGDFNRVWRYVYTFFSDKQDLKKHQDLYHT